MAAPLPLELFGMFVDMAEDPDGQEFQAATNRYKAYSEACVMNPDKFVASLPLSLIMQGSTHACGDALVECERLAIPRQEGEDEATFHYRQLKTLLLVRAILRECDSAGVTGMGVIRGKLNHAAKQLQKRGLPNVNAFFAESAVERWYQAAQAAANLAAAQRSQSERGISEPACPSHYIQEDGLTAPLLPQE